MLMSLLVMALVLGVIILRAMRPLDQVIDITGHVADGDFGMQIVTTRQDEVGRVLRNAGRSESELHHPQRVCETVPGPVKFCALI